MSHVSSLTSTCRLDVGAGLSEVIDAYNNVHKWAKSEKAYAPNSLIV